MASTVTFISAETLASLIASEWPQLAERFSYDNLYESYNYPHEQVVMIDTRWGDEDMDIQAHIEEEGEHNVYWSDLGESIVLALMASGDIEKADYLAVQF